MERGKHELAEAVVEHGTYQFELLVGIAQTVAVGQVEHLAVDFGGDRLLVQYYSALLLQVVVGPDVVVAGEVVHLHTHVGKLRELAQKASVATRHHILVFIPEVEHVAKQVYGAGLLLDRVKEAHEAALLHALVRNGPRAEVGVAQKIYWSHLGSLIQMKSER